MASQPLLDRLQSWYASQCDGDWEHDAGITIQSLDNPGWLVKINLEGTPLESRAFSEIRDSTHHTNWIDCKVEDGIFVGAGGPAELSRILQVFLDWAGRAV